LKGDHDWQGAIEWRCHDVEIRASMQALDLEIGDSKERRAWGKNKHIGPGTSVKHDAAVMRK